MSNIAVLNKEVANNRITSMTDEDIGKVRQLEQLIMKVPQVLTPTSHLFHAGMYSRTILIKEGCVLTGALLTIPTILILSGHFVLFVGDKAKEYTGYNIFAGEANRKQAGLALSDTYATMILTTNSRSVPEVEEEFTNEAHLLWSRQPDAINEIIITETK